MLKLSWEAPLPAVVGPRPGYLNHIDGNFNESQAREAGEESPEG
jgi:hypothetical protein